MLYTVRPVSNTILELFSNPGFENKKDRVDEFAPTNDISDGKADGDLRYGRWSAHPESRMSVARLLANPVGPSPVVVPAFRRDYPDAGDAWKIGGRITHSFGELNAGIGYTRGYNPQANDMVFKMKGAPISCGPPACPPGGTLVRADLVNDQTNIFAAHFNYPIGEPLGIPIKSAMRGELAFTRINPTTSASFQGGIVRPVYRPVPGPVPAVSTRTMSSRSIPSAMLWALTDRRLSHFFRTIPGAPFE